MGDGWRCALWFQPVAAASADNDNDNRSNNPEKTFKVFSADFVPFFEIPILQRKIGSYNKSAPLFWEAKGKLPASLDHEFIGDCGCS